METGGRCRQSPLLVQSLILGAGTLSALSNALALVDETAISVRGGQRYLYRAVDKFGKTVDSLRCADRGVWAAQAFFCKAVRTHHPRPPSKVNLDGNAASHQALRVLRKENPNPRSVVTQIPLSQQHRQARPCNCFIID
jgi:transposase-like protein